MLFQISKEYFFQFDWLPWLAIVMQDLKKEQDGRQKNLVVLFSSLIYERTDKYVIIKRKKVYSFRNDEVYFKIIYSSEENHKNVLMFCSRFFYQKLKTHIQRASRFSRKLLTIE